jgi:hypothetical protein
VYFRASPEPHEILNAAMHMLVDTSGDDAQLHSGHTEKILTDKAEAPKVRRARVAHRAVVSQKEENPGTH